MFCSKCGGDMAVGAQFCSKCGNNGGVSVGSGAAVAPAKTANAERRGVRPSYVVALLVVLAVCGTYVVIAVRHDAQASSFTQADVQKTETDIKSQFEKNGFVVAQVHMVRDSDRHMTGYATVRKPGLLTGKFEVTKNCAASMDESSGRYFWQCK